MLMVSRSGEACKMCGRRGSRTSGKLQYLGVMISGDGGCDDEIKHRIGAAARVVGAMRKEGLKSRDLQKKTKVRVFMLW